MSTVGERRPRASKDDARKRQRVDSGSEAGQSGAQPELNREQTGLAGLAEQTEHVQAAGHGPTEGAQMDAKMDAPPVDATEATPEEADLSRRLADELRARQAASQSKADADAKAKADADAVADATRAGPAEHKYLEYTGSDEFDDQPRSRQPGDSASGAGAGTRAGTGTGTAGGLDGVDTGAWMYEWTRDSQLGIPHFRDLRTASPMHKGGTQTVSFASMKNTRDGNSVLYCKIEGTIQGAGAQFQTGFMEVGGSNMYFHDNREKGDPTVYDAMYGTLGDARLSQNMKISPSDFSTAFRTITLTSKHWTRTTEDGTPVHPGAMLPDGRSEEGAALVELLRAAREDMLNYIYSNDRLLAKEKKMWIDELLLVRPDILAMPPDKKAAMFYETIMRKLNQITTKAGKRIEHKNEDKQVESVDPFESITGKRSLFIDIKKRTKGVIPDLASLLKEKDYADLEGIYRQAAMAAAEYGPESSFLARLPGLYRTKGLLFQHVPMYDMANPNVEVPFDECQVDRGAVVSLTLKIKPYILITTSVLCGIKLEPMALYRTFAAPTKVARTELRLKAAPFAQKIAPRRQASGALGGGSLGYAPRLLLD